MSTSIDRTRCICWRELSCNVVGNTLDKELVWSSRYKVWCSIPAHRQNVESVLKRELECIESMLAAIRGKAHQMAVNMRSQKCHRGITHTTSPDVQQATLLRLVAKTTDYVNRRPMKVCEQCRQQRWLCKQNLPRAGGHPRDDENGAGHD